MEKVNLDDLLKTPPGGGRSAHLHVKISEENKSFLEDQAYGVGITMGLYIEKLLSMVRIHKRKKRKK